MSGTSMAAPHVTGVAALIKSVNPGLTTAQIKHLILNNVDAVPALSGKCVTGGRLNAYKAVNAAKPKWTVTYNANNGSGATINHSFGTGSMPLYLNTFPAPAGKSFEGWATAPNSTAGLVATDGALYTATGNVTLYAVWDTHGNTHETAYEIDGHDLVDYELFSIFNSRIDYEVDIDFFKFQAPNFVSGSAYKINLITHLTNVGSVTGQIYKETRKENKSYISYISGYSSSSGILKMSVTVTLGDTYYFMIRGNNLACVGDYELHIDFGDASAAAYNIGGGNYHTENGMIDFIGDVDFITLMVTTSGNYDIFTESNIDTIGELYDSSQSLISNDNYGGNQNFKIFRYLLTANKIYYIKISANGNDVGAFTLKINPSTTYEVVYNPYAIGVSDMPDNQGKVPNVTLMLSNYTTPHRSGYEFLG